VRRLPGKIYDFWWGTGLADDVPALTYYLVLSLGPFALGLAAILAFIGVKLVLHWAHKVWPATPEVPTLASLAVIVGILALVTVTSLLATRGGRHPDESALDHERAV